MLVLFCAANVTTATKPLRTYLVTTLLRSKTSLLLYITNWKRAPIFLHALLNWWSHAHVLHLHPKSKLIHFAKSSAAPCLAYWWAAGWSFFPPVLCAATKAKRRLTEDARGPWDKKKKKTAEDTRRTEWGFLYQQADTLLLKTCTGKTFFTIFVKADGTIKSLGQIYKWALLCG